MKKYFNLILVLLVSSLLIQSFQCASREMTTARVAVQNNDYPKAIEFFQLEIQKNPSNIEAQIALTETFILMKDTKNAHKSFIQLMQRDTIKMVKDAKPALRNQIWTEAYNTGFNHYASKRYPEALEYIEIGIYHMPRIVDFYSLKATIHELMGDNPKAHEAYIKFVENSKHELDFVRAQKLHLNMPRTDLEKFGKPSNSRPTARETSAGIDSLMTDLYNIKGSVVFFFSEKSERSGNQWKVVGLRVSPPRDWLPSESALWSAYNTSPIAILAANYYRDGDKEKSLEYIRHLVMLEPNNSDANTSMIQLYVELDRKQEAIAEIQQLTKEDPDNKLYWAQYGDLYMNLGEYEKAIEQYEKALKIDPNYDFVVRNLAAVYKNKAHNIQVEEQEKMGSRRDAKINTDAFYPFLKKSADLFERSLKTETFKDDMEVLAELANIYLVLNEKDKIDDIVLALERVERTIPEDQKINFYLRMMKIYGDMQRTEKLEEIERKYNELTK